MIDPEWMTPAQVADHLQVARITVYRALEEGRMHGHKSEPRSRTGRWRIRKTAADAYQMGLNGRQACGCLQVLRSA